MTTNAVTEVPRDVVLQRLNRKIDDEASRMARLRVRTTVPNNRRFRYQGALVPGGRYIVTTGEAVEAVIQHDELEAFARERGCLKPEEVLG